ncbi:MAG: STAS domain-containing protein [Saprospiraceae bacterium]|nr:STAS domain-containing protein [Saprospiraceae bacterium]
MEINIQKSGDVSILELNGRLDTTNYNEIEKKFDELIRNNEVKLLVDCTNLSYISSSGLRVLLKSLKAINAAKGKFILCALQENINEVFEISGFSSIFEICADQSEAMGKF